MVSMAERQSAHRQQLERMATEATIESMRREFYEVRFGQICAAVVALTLIAGGVYVAKIGHPWPGTFMGGGGVIGGVGIPAIISSFTKRKKEEEQSSPKKSGGSAKSQKRR